MTEETQDKHDAAESQRTLNGNEPSGETEGSAAATTAGDQDPLKVALAEAAKYKEQALRALADFDNYRKRSRKEVDDAKRQGREDFLRDFLPVFDNVERAIMSAERATDVKSVVDGLQMIMRQLTDTLSRAGINRVAGVGSAFDPQVHEAIQQVETDEHAAGTVIAEVQPGYVQGERLVRAAMVVVAKAKAGAGEGGASKSSTEDAKSE